MIYDVWVYPVVRVKVAGVEADSQEEAVKKVDTTTDFHALLDRNGLEWAEDIDCFHVDEQGDTEYKNSTWYDKDYSPL
jgi:hypothetical protein